MSLQNQQNFLARLYTDGDLRRNFLSQPAKIGAENDLNETEIAELYELVPEEISFFAESLFWKRLREVEKFLPLTKEFSGKDFIALFRDFSQSFNPKTVKKHLEDAVEFCNFLQKSKVSEIVKTIAKFEQTKIKFFGYGKHFAFCRLNYNLEEISRKDVNVQRNTICIWLKIGKKIRHFSI